MVPNVLLIDSSVWVAWLHESDSQHNQARQIIGLLKSSRVAIHEYVILEVCTVLQIKAGKHTARNFLEMVLDNQDISVIYSSESSLSEACQIFKNQPGSLSLVDCMQVACSSQYPILTFDLKLRSFVRKHKI